MMTTHREISLLLRELKKKRKVLRRRLRRGRVESLTLTTKTSQAVKRSFLLWKENV